MLRHTQEEQDFLGYIGISYSNYSVTERDMYF